MTLDPILQHLLLQSPIAGVVLLAIWKLWNKVDALRISVTRLETKLDDHLCYGNGGKTSHAPSA